MLQYGEYHAKVHLKSRFDTRAYNISSQKRILRKAKYFQTCTSISEDNLKYLEILFLGDTLSNPRSIVDRTFAFRSIFRTLYQSL